MTFKTSIFNIQNHSDFENEALKVFRFQFENNTVYRSFCDLLHKHPADINKVSDIPFLPIQFFKSHKILCQAESSVATTFSSSGTTGTITSKHYVTDIELYAKSYLKGFKEFYGDIKDYVVLALLPSYLERNGSSLIYMVNDLILKSEHKDSGFYLNNYDALASKLKQLEDKQQKTLLIGVSYALLDVVEQYKFNLNYTTVMETGGMKGRRKELTRAELHSLLTQGFGVEYIHSEYGMTELLSQAYSKGNGIFECPPWMNVLTRDTEDPLTLIPHNKTGGLNIIDLANVNSCAFIATQDLGRTHSNGTFEVLGRFDNSDVRGCNLMVID